MEIASALSTTLQGIYAHEIKVEAQVLGNLKRFSIIGLPDSSLKESKERVRCAIENSGFSFPNYEVIVSLAPASLPKQGSGFDLAIAVSILRALGFIRKDLNPDTIFLSELGLSGELKPTSGALGCTSFAKKNNIKNVIVAQRMAKEAALVEGVKVRPAKSLLEVIQHLNGDRELMPIYQTKISNRRTQSPNFDDVVGQMGVKRCMEIAAAGGHNLLMVGPPGAGKSMLAQRLPSILPPLSSEEALEVIQVHASSKKSDKNLISPTRLKRPFRAPHHTTSAAGVIGGGADAGPGEISLSHRGVLFLDELPEFKRSVLESLRTPLESRDVTISRAKTQCTYPANFILVAAMNPCPHGNCDRIKGVCHCTLSELKRYKQKLSAPLLDRIDIHTWVPAVPVKDLTRKNKNAVTEIIQQKVTRAREMQKARFNSPAKLNSSMSQSEVDEHCALDPSESKALEELAEKYNVSARGFMRAKRVARTIADLEKHETVQLAHMQEALSYREPPIYGDNLFQR